MPERVRFAPSPTGELHVGNLRTALYNAALAAGGGAFVLRYDDTDAERSQARYADLIAEDLAWIGLTPDETVRQSERLSLYDEAAERLREAGLLYPCYEAPEELERKRALLRARGRPPIYDRAALALTGEERAALEAEGRRPHWRFRLPGGERSWDDLSRGRLTVDLTSLSDPILVREDGSYLYTLPSVVDDAALDITAVVRGEDHVTNTGVQIALFEALGAASPRFGHHNLLTRADGEPLSKRDNPLSLARLRADGFEPMAPASLAVLVGTSQPLEPVATLEALLARADLGSVSKGPATFDPAELDRLNAALLHETRYEAVADWLAAAHGVSDPRVWHALRANLARRTEIADWLPVLASGRPAGEVPADAAPVIEAARAELPAEPWDEATFAAWSKAVRQATGAKGKALFMPLRLALTGRASGPELGPLLPLIGRAEVARRLAEAARA